MNPVERFRAVVDDYNMDGYTNYWQNLNVIAWAKSVLDEMES